MRIRIALSLAGLLIFIAAAARAADAPSPAPFQPKYEALRFGKVKMHTGPGRQYPVEWVYQRKGYPVKVTAAYDVWRRIVDPEGASGWVEDTMLADKRTVTVTGSRATLRHDPSDTAPPVALADPGTIAEVAACRSGWCRVKFTDYAGWLRQSSLWGTDANETFGAAE